MTEIFRRIMNHKLTRRFLKDTGWRVRLSLLGSVSLNIFYVIMMLASGIFFRAKWFYALALYYFLLVIMRVFLIKETAESERKKNVLKEFRRYRFCGIIMLFMNQALVVIVGYMVRSNHVTFHSTLHTAVLSVYTFSAIIWAGFNVVRYRRFNSPLFSAAKAISLVSATVSLLSLEASVASGFESAKDARILMAITGFMVCTFVLTMAVFMIIRANKQIKLLEKYKTKK